MNADYYRKMSLNSLMKEKKTNCYRKDMELAQEILKDEPGEWISRDADYEIAWYQEPTFKIIFYPHQTKNTGNRHIRIRGQGTGRQRYQYLMAKLSKESGPDCSFTWKNFTFKQESEWLKDYL